MQELNNGLCLSLAGPEAETALAAFERQMDAWGLVAPAVEPLALDFGIGQFSQIGLIEYWIANEKQAGYCGKYLFVFDGQQCPAHSHRVKHETFFPIRGSLEVTFNERSFTLKPGDVLPVPPNHVHSFRGQENALLLELSMPCDISDNCFEDPRIHDWLSRVINSLSKT